jgi:hypothetical protein
MTTVVEYYPKPDQLTFHLKLERPLQAPLLTQLREWLSETAQIDQWSWQPRRRGGTLVVTLSPFLGDDLIWRGNIAELVTGYISAACGTHITVSYPSGRP